MSIQCFCLLWNLKKLSNNSDETMCLIDGHTQICLLHDLSKYYDYQKYEREINAILSALSDKKCICFESNKCYFHMTHYGIHPIQFFIEEAIHFMVRSILVPIIVSIITTIIMNRFLK